MNLRKLKLWFVDRRLLIYRINNLEEQRDGLSEVIATLSILDDEPWIERPSIVLADTVEFGGHYIAERCPRCDGKAFREGLRCEYCQGSGVILKPLSNSTNRQSAIGNRQSCIGDRQ